MHQPLCVMRSLIPMPMCTAFLIQIIEKHLWWYLRVARKAGVPRKHWYRLCRFFILQTRWNWKTVILEFSVYPIDRYQNAIHELKQIQEHFTLMPHDSFGHLNTLCMSVLSLSGGVESEWKRSAHRSALKKRLAFEYESSFITQISNSWIPH